MSIFLLLALQAAPGAVLEPTSSRQKWLDASDYPSSELRGGRGGIVIVKVIIAPNGSPEKCLIVSSSGNDVINDVVCNLSMKRIRFKNPIFVNGQRTYGIWQRRAVLLPPGSPAPGKEPSSNFKVISQTAEPKSKDLDVKVVVSVDENGEIQGCNATDMQTSLPSVQQACEQIKNIWQPAPEKSASGTPIRYVRWSTVTFVSR